MSLFWIVTNAKMTNKTYLTKENPCFTISRELGEPIMIILEQYNCEHWLLLNASSINIARQTNLAWISDI